jgi:hypothetical protein
MRLTLVVVLLLTLVTIGCGAAPTLSTRSAGAPSGVIAPMLHSITVSPKSVSLAVGGTQTYTAQGVDASGKQFPVSMFAWHSDNLDVASVSASASGAVVNAVGEGTANITATASGVTSLNAAVVVSADATPIPAPIPTPVAPAQVVLTFAIAITGSASSSFTVALGTPLGCYALPLPSGIGYQGAGQYWNTVNFSGSVCFVSSGFSSVEDAQPTLVYVGEGMSADYSGNGLDANIVNFAAIINDASQGSMLIVAQLDSTDGINYSGQWGELWAANGNVTGTGSITARMVGGGW